MSFNTIIFDMDGVLIDTEYHYAQVFDAFFDKKGIPIAHLNRRELLGRPLRDLWPFILGEDFDKKDAARLQKEFFTYKKSSHFPIEEMLFSDVLVIEDSSNGIAAGAIVWAIRNQQFDSDQSQVDRRVEHLTEVLELLGFS